MVDQAWLCTFEPDVDASGYVQIVIADKVLTKDLDEVKLVPL